MPMPGGPNNKVTEPADHPAAQHAVELAHTGRQRARARRRDVGQAPRQTRQPPPHPSRRTGRAPTKAPNVFHAPQLGQRPTQRSEVASQAVQR